MENHYKEVLRFQLMEEIGKINTHVAALGKPKGTVERSLIARYGKLLFVSQQLMDTLPKLQAISTDTRQIETHPDGDTTPIIPKHMRGSFSRRFGLA
ncbi:MAG: hypothetical protein H6963_10410 [Chromatiaceae bacterium]|nr:hypothetical protein [Chromatiaceae bacterium]MCP5409695.1 hypothetical protein [Chromatiaceae bacterium]MCP5442757.1 hypothetical protein [Chromatiaceae bacterium]